MKTFMKVCGIIALILLGAGTVFTIMGFVFGGPGLIAEGVSKATGGRVAFDLDLDDGDYGIRVGDYSTNDIGNMLEAFMDNAVFSLGDKSDIFDANVEIETGNIEYHEMDFDGVDDLKINMEGCNFQIGISEDDKFYLEAEDIEEMQVYAKDDTLYVKSSRSGEVTGAMIKDSEIRLYIPENYSFDKVEIDLGAGFLHVEQIKAKKIEAKIGAGEVEIGGCNSDKLEINVGAGNFTVHDMEIGELNCEVGMGNVFLNGAISGDAKAECSMGNISLALENDITDFNYKLEASMGNITLDGKEYAGFASEKKIDNQASKTIKLQCNMGNIDVSFQ